MTSSMRGAWLDSIALITCAVSGPAWAALCTAAPGGCTGCCQNGCQAGDAGDACGSNGVACVACTGGTACIAGQCSQPSCGLCLLTCCQTNGTCAPSATNQQCGLPGAPCVQCAAGATCTLGICVGLCNPLLCPNGCCDSTGNCQGASDATCGFAGSACADCAAGGGFCSADAGYQCAYLVDAGSDAGTPADAGPTDAGTPDAGSVGDAGADGGVPADGGPGQPDGGARAGLIANLGCNCGIGGTLWFGLVSLIALARRRTRRGV